MDTLRSCLCLHSAEWGGLGIDRSGLNKTLDSLCESQTCVYVSISSLSLLSTLCSPYSILQGNIRAQASKPDVSTSVKKLFKTPTEASELLLLLLPLLLEMSLGLAVACGLSVLEMLLMLEVGAAAVGCFVMEKYSSVRQEADDKHQVSADCHCTNELLEERCKYRVLAAAVNINSDMRLMFTEMSRATLPGCQAVLPGRQAGQYHVHRVQPVSNLF